MTPFSLDRELHLDRPLDDIRRAAVLSIVHTANMIAQAGVALFRQYGLTEAQFNVLFSLKYKESEVTQSDLGERLVVTRASVTSVLDKLENKGLVRRNTVPGNRRIFHVTLTREGAALIERVEPVYRATVHRVMNGLSEKELNGLIAQLERVRADLREMPAMSAGSQ